MAKTYCCTTNNPKVTDDKDHYPINSTTQAKNLAQKINDLTEKPSWWKGTLNQLKNTVMKCIKQTYPKLMNKQSSDDILSLYKQAANLMSGE